MNHNTRLYVAGHTGLVGSALLNALQTDGYVNIITRTHSDLDLTCQHDVNAFFQETQPECVVLAAARVGGIWANSRYSANFIYENLTIQTNVIHAAWQAGVDRLLFLGSSCIYPRDCPQPMKESYLLSGTLEQTNEAYAIAKIAGIKMCQFYNQQYGTRFLSVMPTNLYGPNDNFDLEDSHVLPALIRKFHEAKFNYHASVEIWGSGKPLREFLFVNDLAEACLFLLKLKDADYLPLVHTEDAPIINIGTGKETSIRNLADLVKTTVGFEGDYHFNTAKPDGTPRKLLDIRRMRKLNWQAKTSLKNGLRHTYTWYQQNQSNSAIHSNAII